MLSVYRYDQNKRGVGLLHCLQFLWMGLSRMIILSMCRKQLNLFKCLLIFCPGNFSLEVGTYAFQCQEPTNSFACEVPVCGSLSPVFIFALYCSALEKREILHLTKISRYTVL